MSGGIEPGEMFEGLPLAVKLRHLEHTPEREPAVLLVSGVGVLLLAERQGQSKRGAGIDERQSGGTD